VVSATGLPNSSAAMRESPQAVRRRVGRRIRALRFLQELSLEQLAERAKISDKHLALVELSKVNVGIDVLTKIAAGLSVSLADLVDTAPSRRQVALITKGDLDQFVEAGRRALRLRNRLVRAPRRRE
jgi:transcriptional regulator with XRE-family HTH domain